MSRQWFGNVNNRIRERVKCPMPEVGMGATEYCWSDRHAYEVIDVIDERHITVRRLIAIRVDEYGMSDCQDYKYESDPDGVIANLFLTKEGLWKERYNSRKLGCNTWGVGVAEEYYDYGF